jgi:hypothetical protein
MAAFVLTGASASMRDVYGFKLKWGYMRLQRWSVGPLGRSIVVVRVT